VAVEPELSAASGEAGEGAASAEEAGAGCAAVRAVRDALVGPDEWVVPRDLPSFEILIASVYRRHDQLVGLLDSLRPQLAPFMGQARVIVTRDDCQAPVGAKRNQLLLAATAEWTCFVDDDDQVADNYVQRIFEALIPRPDYVGFNVSYTIDGVLQKPVVHSLTHERWWEDEHGYYRGISHLNPIRRTAALAGLPFLPGFGEDADWAARVSASGLVRSETYIEGAPMYFYDYRSEGSLFRHGPRQTGSPAPAFPEHLNVRELA
jgi:glycosyltransferase involved in cell wall biosynthesis